MPENTTAPLLDLSFLRSRAARWRIAVSSLVCTALGVVYALMAPVWFASTLTLVPARGQRSGISGVLGAELGSLAAGLGDGGSGSADPTRIATVVQSASVSDAVIEKLDLRRRYNARWIESARAALWEHCDAKILLKPGLVQMTCEDKDPRFAQQMLVAFVEYGNQAFTRVNAGAAAEEARFLEKRVKELRDQSDAATAHLQEFQELHQIVDIDTQAKAVVSTLAALQSQRINKQLDLEYAKTFSAGDEATIRQLESQLSVVNDKVRDLEQASSAGPRDVRRERAGRAAGGVFPAALAVPKLRADYERLVRDRMVSEASLVFALERLETAKANEARSASTFQVLDPPTLPDRKSRPRRSVIVLACAALSLAAGLGFEWARARGLAHSVLAVLGLCAQPRRAAEPQDERVA